MAEESTAPLKIDDLSNLKVADLKRELKDRGLPVSGNKTELIERLQSHLQENNENEDLAIEDTTIGLTDAGDDNDSDIEIGADDSLLQEEKAEILETHDVDPELDTSETAEEPSKPVIQKITMSNKEEKENGVEAKTVLSPDEKKKQRAERFGVQSEDARKQTRAERFGIPTKTPSSGGSKSGAISHTPITADDIDKLKKRSERFGTTVSTSLSKAEDAGKLKQRAERFGAIVAPSLSKVEEQERILKRKERFGAQLAGTDTTNKVVSSDEVEAKKQKRAERFAMS